MTQSVCESRREYGAAAAHLLVSHSPCLRVFANATPLPQETRATAYFKIVAFTLNAGHVGRGRLTIISMMPLRPERRTREALQELHANVRHLLGPRRNSL